MTRDSRVDDYIANAPDFARPILTHLREEMHRALGDAEETIKWGMPHFMIGGKNIAGIAAFKAHCALVIHGDGRQGEGMGGYGKIARLDDLPSAKALEKALKDAKQRVIEKGTAARAKKASAKTVKAPPQGA